MTQPLCFECKTRPAGNDYAGPHPAYCAGCQPRDSRPQPRGSQCACGACGLIFATVTDFDAHRERYAKGHSLEGVFTGTHRGLGRVPVAGVRRGRRSPLCRTSTRQSKGVSARHWHCGVHWGRRRSSRRPGRRVSSRRPGRRVSSRRPGQRVNERRQRIPSSVQDPEEIVHEASCGVWVTDYEHYQDHYQSPAEGPAHDSFIAARRCSITRPPRCSDFMLGIRWAA